MTTTQAQTVKLANVDAETAAKAGKALGAAFGSFKAGEARIERNLIAETLAAARIIGTPVTRAQLHKQFLPDAKAEALRKGRAVGLEKATVDSHFSRAQWIILGALLMPSGYDPAAKGADGEPVGPHWSQHIAGESFRAMCDRVALQLTDAKLPNGDFVLERGEDGKAKALPGAKRSAAPAASAGGAQAQEGGTNANAAKAKAEARETAAIVLMGNPKDAAALLALLDKHMSDVRKLIADKVTSPAAPVAKAA